MSVELRLQYSMLIYCRNKCLSKQAYDMFYLKASLSMYCNVTIAI